MAKDNSDPRVFGDYDPQPAGKGYFTDPETDPLGGHFHPDPDVRPCVECADGV